MAEPCGRGGLFCGSDRLVCGSGLREFLLDESAEAEFWRISSTTLLDDISSMPVFKAVEDCSEKSGDELASRELICFVLFSDGVIANFVSPSTCLFSTLLVFVQEELHKSVGAKTFSFLSFLKYSRLMLPALLSTELSRLELALELLSVYDTCRPRPLGASSLTPTLGYLLVLSTELSLLDPVLELPSSWVLLDILRAESGLTSLFLLSTELSLLDLGLLRLVLAGLDVFLPTGV